MDDHANPATQVDAQTASAGSAIACNTKAKQFAKHRGPEDDRVAFTAARAEILSRMGWRDQAGIAFLTVSTAINGTAMACGKPALALMVPLYALAAAVQVSQHTCALHDACCWTRRHFRFMHYSRSDELRGMHAESLPARFLGNALTFAGPSIVAVLLTVEYSFAQPSVLRSGLWWMGIAAIVSTCFVLMRTRGYVRAVNRRAGYGKDPPN